MHNIQNCSMFNETLKNIFLQFSQEYQKINADLYKIFPGFDYSCMGQLQCVEQYKNVSRSMISICVSPNPLYSEKKIRGQVYL